MTCDAWYPGVELNHASDVRSVGSDPSTGASGASCWYRVRESNPRCRSENPVSWPSGRTRLLSRRSSTGRESNPRSALCRRVPCHLATGAKFRCEGSNLDSRFQRPASCRWTTPERIVEPSLGVEPSPLAYQASVPRRGHRDGDREDRAIGSWRGPESNRPQPHCKCSSPPWHMPPRARSRRGSNSPIAVDSRASSPEDFGTRWARLGRAPVLGVRRESNPHYEIHRLACDHHTAHTM